MDAAFDRVGTAEESSIYHAFLRACGEDAELPGGERPAVAIRKPFSDEQLPSAVTEAVSR